MVSKKFSGHHFEGDTHWFTFLIFTFILILKGHVAL